MTGLKEGAYTPSPSPYNSSHDSDWSWPFGERNFDEPDLYEWPIDDDYLSSTRSQRPQIKSARKAEKRRKAEERRQRKFIKRYGKIFEYQSKFRPDHYLIKQALYACIHCYISFEVYPFYLLTH